MTWTSSYSISLIMDKPKSFMTSYMIPLAILLPMLLKNAAAQQMSPNEFNVGK